MATTFTWLIDSLDCFPEWQGQTDVVMRVHWYCIGTDGEYTASAAGCTSITPDPKAEFTPFDKLTPDEVASWVKAELDAKPTNSESSQGLSSADYEAMVNQMLDQQRKPPIVTLPVPWG